MNKFAIGIIKSYQFILSPMMGGQCRFYPSCSHYAIDAFKHHHFFKACYLTLYRLGRCQPFCCGGVDPIPTKSSRGHS